MLNVDDKLVQNIVALAKQAGEAILEVYNREGDISVETKSDSSPITEADLAAHNIICAGLGDLDSTPILSEESADIDFAVRQQWTRYWLVDPLDGTKEFINRNDEFTVNIALIENGDVKLGVVYAPVLATCYFAAQGFGAFKEKDGAVESIGVRKLDKKNEVVVVASRRHGADKLAPVLSEIEVRFGAYSTASMGSSLKMCLVAEGAADLYPRLALTSEWDTAAAQAVVEQSGGCLLDPGFKPLRYNQKDSLLNPFFFVLGDQKEKWDWLTKYVD